MKSISRLLLLLLSWSVGAALARAGEVPIVIDLSGTRSWEEVSASGAPFIELKGLPLSTVYRLENQCVTWKFPGGVSFQHHISQGSVEYEDGQLRHMSSFGEMMPLDEVMTLAKRLHVLLGEPSSDLEKWAATEGIKGTAGQSYSFGARDCEPIIDCEIHRSFGSIYPWMLVVRASWHPNINPSKARRSPFKESISMNLDPPSGKRYTPEEDFRLYQEKHGYKEPPPPSPWQAAKTPAKKTEEPPPPPVKSEAANSGESDASGWLLATAAMAVLGGALLFWRMKSRS